MIIQFKIFNNYIYKKNNITKANNDKSCKKMGYLAAFLFCLNLRQIDVVRQSGGCKERGHVMTYYSCRQKIHSTFLDDLQSVVTICGNLLLSFFQTCSMYILIMSL